MPTPMLCGSCVNPLPNRHLLLLAAGSFVRFFFMPHRHRPMTYHAFRSHLAAVHVGSGGAGGGVISIR